MDECVQKVGQFDGQFINWLQFHEKYVQAVHINEELEAVVKGKALKKMCQRSAAQLTNRYEAMEYSEMYEKLTAMYENPYMQLVISMSELLEVPKISPSLKQQLVQVIATVD